MSSRRRLLLQSIQREDGTKSKWYTLGELDSISPYAFSIILGGTTYKYESDYPFYFIEDETGFYISYEIYTTTRNGTKYGTGVSNGTINDRSYRKETTKRTVGVISKTDIFVWEG